MLKIVAPVLVAVSVFAYLPAVHAEDATFRVTLVGSGTPVPSSCFPFAAGG
jgi:hypothetical protein